MSADFREQARRIARLAEIEARIAATVSAIMDNGLVAWPRDYPPREEDRDGLADLLAELLRERAQLNPSAPSDVLDTLSDHAARHQEARTTKRALNGLADGLRADKTGDVLREHIARVQDMPEPEEAPIDPRQRNSWYMILDALAAQCGIDLQARDAVGRIRTIAARHGKPLPDKHETIRNRLRNS